MTNKKRVIIEDVFIFLLVMKVYDLLEFECVVKYFHFKSHDMDVCCLFGKKEEKVYEMTNYINYAMKLNYIVKLLIVCKTVVESDFW